MNQSLLKFIIICLYFSPVQKRYTMSTPQQALFASEPEKSIVQHNAITMARYEITAVEKKIMYMLQSMISSGDDIMKTYFIPVRELMIKCGTQGENYTYIKQATKKILSRIYEIPKENGGFLQIGLMSSAEYDPGSGMIEVSFDPKIRPYLLDLKSHFTIMKLEQALNLKSIYAQRIYEILCSYKSTGWYIVKLDDFKAMLRIENKYLESFSMFKKKVLEQAKKEMEMYTDMSFEYFLVKTGKKVTSIKFIICINEGKGTKDEDFNNTLFNRLVNDFKLSAWQSKRVLEHLTESEINRTLYEIKIKVSNKKVNDIGGYTAATFEKKFDLGFKKTA